MIILRIILALIWIVVIASAFIYMGPIAGTIVMGPIGIVAGWLPVFLP